MQALRSVGDLCSRDVVTAPRSTPLTEAARLMREHHVGCLVIVDDAAAGPRVAGLVTDRDIVTAVVAKEVSPSLLCVADVMSEDVVTLGEEASVHEALVLMRQRGVRRVPVRSDAGTLTGLLSADDLVRLLALELQALSEVLSGQRRLEQRARP